MRTTVFSAIANYTLDDKTVAVLVTHLQEMQVAAETVQRIEDALVANEHLIAADKDLIKKYTVDLAPEQVRFNPILIPFNPILIRFNPI